MYRFLLRNSILNVETCRVCRQVQVHRNIYTAKQLLIDEYVNNRQTYQQTVEPGLNLIVKDQLRKSLNHRVIGQKFLLNLMQFTNCIDDTKEDFQLMERSLFTLKRLSMENVRTKQIGLILIKMLHHFRKDTLAQKLYSDAIIWDHFFRTRRSNLIFFDMLYKQGKYAAMKKHFETLKERLEAKEMFVIQSIYVLIFAASYKENTTKSFAYAKRLHDESEQLKQTQTHFIFLSALALNRNEPEYAERLLSTLWPTAHEAIFSLRLIAFLRMKMFANANQLLNSLPRDCDQSAPAKSRVISNEAIQEADTFFDKYCTDERLQNDYRDLRQKAYDNELVVNKQLDAMICEPFALDEEEPEQRTPRPTLPYVESDT